MNGVCFGRISVSRTRTFSPFSPPFPRPAFAAGFTADVACFLATLGSGIGTWLAAIALTVDVYDRTHSGEWVSALLVADFLPGIFVGLLLGSLIDRLSRRRLMMGADLVRLGVFCALPFIGSVGAIVAAAAVIGLANGFFVPSVHAGLPNLVAEDELVPANSLFQTADNLSWAVGPLLGGALVALQGPHLAYWLNAATFLGSANIIEGVVKGGRFVLENLSLALDSDSALEEGEKVKIVFRPEDVFLRRPENLTQHYHPFADGTIEHESFVGAFERVTVRVALPGDPTITVLRPKTETAAFPLKIGQKVPIGLVRFRILGKPKKFRSRGA